jgi:4-amino-4-deoxy-L-arabinose transferase-like glycosyltransferase
MTVTSGTATRGEPVALKDRAHRLTRSARAVPKPLAAILTIAVITGLLWALLVPAWQSPDEVAHFAYAQSLAERFALPGAPGRSVISDDQLLADRLTGAEALAFRPGQIRPPWSAAEYRPYRAAANRGPSRSNGGGPNPAAYDPPLYYVFADLAYWTTYGGNAFDRYYAMRIWGVSLLALTVIATWLLIGELLGPRRTPQLAGSAVVGLIPGVTFTSTSINPDALMISLWTVALWLGVRVIKHAARPRDTVWLLAVTAAAILTQPISYALAPAALLAVIIGWVRCPRDARRGRIGRGGLAALIVSLPVIAWVVARGGGNPALAQIGRAKGQPAYPFNVRQFLSYIWQFYLPRLPGMFPDRVTGGLSVYNIWVRQGWGTFGWLDVPMSGWVYTVVGGFTALIGVASAAIVARFRDRLRWQLMAFFAVAVLALLAGLHLTEYRSLLNGNGPYLQGRYLLPVVGVFGLAVAIVVDRLPGRWQGTACAVLLPSMLLLQVIALSTVAAAYYT